MYLGVLLMIFAAELLVETKAQTPAPTCKKPPLPPNAFVFYPPNLKSQFNLQERIYYRCKPGYDQLGLGVQECQINGWTSVGFKCVGSGNAQPAKPCNDPGTPQNGKKIGASFTVGSRIRFQCNVGYDLIGKNEITCLANGQWSVQVAKCYARCTDPGKPRNGRRVGDNFGHSVQVFFYCLRGYRLQGSRLLTCTNGTWNSVIPKCVGQACTAPELPSGAVLVHLIPLKKLQPGAMAIFACRGGFYLRGSPIRHCRSGQWSKAEFKCIAPCFDLPPMKHGKIEYRLRNGEQEARFSCKKGHTMEGGNSTLKCIKNKWVGVSPVCRAPCQDPGYPEHGTRFGYEFAHNKTVNFQCMEGYKLNGSSTLTCVDGNWSTSTPTCES